MKPPASTTVSMISAKPKVVIPMAPAKSLHIPLAKPVADSKRIALPFKLNRIKKCDQAFIESLFAISDKISNLPFDSAILIGKKSLFTAQILAAKIKGVVIYEDLSTISKENLTKLLEKVRKLKNESTVCCLMFDLSSVSASVNLSSCSFYGCNKPLNSVIRIISYNHPMERIKGIVRKLSLILPVIVFPLFPAAVYVANSLTREMHEMTHMLLKIKNVIENVVIKDDLFDNCFEDIGTNWDKLLKTLHKNSVCYPFMLKFLNYGATFFKRDTDYDCLKVHYISKKMTWMAFIFTVLQTCVCSGEITLCPITSASVSTLPSEKSEDDLSFILFLQTIS